MQRQAATEIAVCNLAPRGRHFIHLLEQPAIDPDADRCAQYDNEQHCPCAHLFHHTFEANPLDHVGAHQQSITAAEIDQCRSHRVRFVLISHPYLSIELQPASGFASLRGPGVQIAHDGQIVRIEQQIDGSSMRRTFATIADHLSQPLQSQPRILLRETLHLGLHDAIGFAVDHSNGEFVHRYQQRRRADRKH